MKAASVLDKLRPLEAASFYVHVPFCSRKCDYCDFYSLPGVGPDQAAASIDETIRQIGAFRAALGAPRVQTIFIGGGTPSSVPLAALERLLAAFADDKPEEFTVEANPESLGPAFLEALARAGVTRLSLGLQSFDERLRGLIGRSGGAAAAAAALEAVAAGWTRDWSADLIYGLPGQSPAAADRDLERLLSFGPPHVSLYALSVEEATPLAERIAAGAALDVDEELQESMRERLEARLKEAGLRRYEISNYCRPGKQCLHNLAYWKLRPYAGCGPSAVSTLMGADGSALRLTVSERPDGFSRDFELEAVAARDFAKDFFIMGLRLVEGLDGAEFRRVFGLDFHELIEASLRRLDRAWFSESGESLALSADGLRMQNAVLRSILDDIDNYNGELALEWP